jgi:hypothetical protein
MQKYVIFSFGASVRIRVLATPELGLHDHTLLDMQQWVELLWLSGQPVAETST